MWLVRLNLLGTTISFFTQSESNVKIADMAKITRRTTTGERKQVFASD